MPTAAFALNLPSSLSVIFERKRQNERKKKDFLLRIYLSKDISTTNRSAKELKCTFQVTIFFILFFSRALHIFVFFFFKCKTTKKYYDEPGIDNVSWYKLYYVSLKIIVTKKKEKWMLKCVPCLRNNLPMDSVCYYWCWWPELRFSDIAVISAIIKFNSCHTTSLQKFIVKQKHIHILWIPLLGDSFVEKKVQKKPV